MFFVVVRASHSFCWLAQLDLRLVTLLNYKIVINLFSFFSRPEVFVSLFAWTPVVLSARLHYCVYLAIGSGRRPMPLQAVLGLTSLSAPHPSSRFPPVTIVLSRSLTHSAALNASNYLSARPQQAFPPQKRKHASGAQRSCH